MLQHMLLLFFREFLFSKIFRHFDELKEILAPAQLKFFHEAAFICGSHCARLQLLPIETGKPRMIADPHGLSRAITSKPKILVLLQQLVEEVPQFITMGYLGLIWNLKLLLANRQVQFIPISIGERKDTKHERIGNDTDGPPVCSHVKGLAPHDLRWCILGRALRLVIH